MNTRSRQAAGTAIPCDDPIVQAAIIRFSHDGFDASVRSIAEAAGVSAALVIKRFSSKDGLRDRCDEVVQQWIREVKHDNIEAASGGRLLDRLQSAEEYAPLLGYCLQSVRAGGHTGRAFVEHMIEDAERYTQEAVDAGIIRESRDPRARVRYLVMSSLGAFLLELLLEPSQPGESLATTSQRLQNASMLPMLELFTHGLFTDRRMLDDYLMQVPDPPAEA